MSSRINPGWENKIGPFKEGTTEEEKTNIITIINQFERDEIFNPDHNVNEIFNHIYKEGSNSQAKRQPNPFMIFRIVLGLVANRNKTKIGDGTSQSKIAGHMWKGSSQDEKSIFARISENFKSLHKEKFPGYEYKPRIRPQVTGFAENMTSKNFESEANRPPNPQEASMHQLLFQAKEQQILSEDNSDMLDLSVLDPTMILNGSYPQLMQDPLDPLQSLYYHQFSPMGQFLISQQFNQLNQPQLNVLNTMNMEKVNYPLQQQQQQQPSSISLNCIDQFDPNLPNYPFNFNYPNNFS